jgi:catechol 2,3-dioxygenase-like lactoylglutathione lyase family enzyme
MINPNLILLYVEELAKSVSFYRDLLGREPAVQAPNFASFPLSGGFSLGLWGKAKVLPAPTGTGSGGEIGIMIAGEGAVDRQYDTWKAAGHQFIQELITLDFGPTFVIVDPDGHRIRVCEPDK